MDVDLRAAIAALASYFDRPVSFGAVPTVHVTLETPHPVARSAVLGLARGVVESQGLELAADSAGTMYVVRSRIGPSSQNGGSPGGSVGPQSTGATEPEAPQFFVIHLHHAPAADVAATINALYGRASALGESSLSSRTLSQQLTQNQLRPPSTGESSPLTTQNVSASADRAASFTGETSIVPDGSTNSLFIRANRNDFALIQAAVQQLDVRPLQVLVEVIIAEIDRNSSFSMGLNASGQRTKSGGSDTASGSLASGLGLGDFVAQVMHHGNPAYAAQLSLAAAKGSAHILSRPVVLASNNQEAEILVGSQQPFIQVQQTQVGAVAQNQVVQYEPVGTRLLVRPTISGDGYVTLDVTQEVNSATTQVVFNAPVISTRTLHTKLLVHDGQTVVLGGLSDREFDKSSSGIPILSSIPIIGGLFGGTSRSHTQSEFFLFLTPHIIATDDAADSLTTPFERRTDSVQPDQ